MCLFAAGCGGSAATTDSTARLDAIEQRLSDLESTYDNIDSDLTIAGEERVGLWKELTSFRESVVRR